MADTFTAYSYLPICNIKVVETVQKLVQFNLVQPFLLAKSGNSNPLVVGYANQGFIVTKDIQVSIEVIEGDIFGVFVNGAQTRTLEGGKSSPFVMFELSANHLSVVGIQLFVRITVELIDDLGNWSQFFAAPDDVLVEITQISHSGVSFQLRSSGLEVISTNSLLFRPYCPSQGVIYFKLVIDDIYNLASSPNSGTTQLTNIRQEIITKAQNFYDFSINDPLQLQYGFANSDVNQAYTEISILNLLSSKKYKIQAICQNNFGLISSNILEFHFTTINNGGIIQKIPLSFDRVLSLPEKIQVACFLSIFLHIHPSSIFTNDKVTCAPYSEQYDFNNSQGFLKYIQQSSSDQFTFYFIPDWRSPVDYVTSIILSELSTPTFQFRLNRFINDNYSYQFSEWNLGLPSTVSHSFPSISNVGQFVPVHNSALSPPIINEEYFIDINQQSSTITINLIRLNKTGFVFVALENTLQDLTLTTYYENFRSSSILKGLNYIDKPVTYGVQLAQGQDSKDLNFTFVNLEYSNNYDRYELFMVVSEDDPSPFAMKSTLRKVTLMHFIPQVTSSLLSFPYLFLLLSIIICCIV